MTKQKVIAYGFLILLVVGIFYYSTYIENFFQLSLEKIQDFNAGSGASVKEASGKEISAPPPLRTEKESAWAYLTQGGVIEFTDVEREKNGEKILKENAELNRAAERKARDILEKQYFDHVSPDGNGPDYFVDSAGYEYITIGENLALGNFADDQALVDAWMASPGHRENILQKKFQEIGVAVVRGTFEGEITWVAVQEFGTPIDVCPKSDASLKNQISQSVREIDQSAKDLERREAEIKKTSKRRSNYNDLVDQYNEQVRKHNSLVTDTKSLIAKYNTQVNQYNACVKSF